MIFSIARSQMIALSPLVLVGLLMACAVGPDYVPPQKTGEMDQWQEAMEAGIVPSEADVSRWWRHLQDPLLDALVARALEVACGLRK